MLTHPRTTARPSIVHGKNGQRGVLATSPVGTKEFDPGRVLSSQKQDVAASHAREKKRRRWNATGGVLMGVHPVSGNATAKKTIGDNVAIIVSTEHIL